MRCASLARWKPLALALLILPWAGMVHSTPTTAGVERILEEGPGPYDVVVTFHDDPSPQLREQIQRFSPGASSFEIVPGVEATLTRNQLLTLADHDEVAAIHPDQGLEFTLDSSKRAMRAGRRIEDLGYTGSDVGVAVVDSGIDQTHPALDDRVVANVRVAETGHVVPITEDREGHGTHVAGIVAGTGDQSPSGSYDGIATGAKLVGVDVSDEFTVSTVVNAYDWILDHQDAYDIRVVVASWGRTDETYDPQDPIVRASSELAEAGIVVVYSAGNAGPGEGTLSVEAQNPDVIAVGAVDDSADIAPYSSRGPGVTDVVKPDLVAPGDEITSTKSTYSPTGLVGGLLGSDGSSSVDSYYTSRSGTSQSAPHVAGLAALVLSAKPELGPEGVEVVLQESAIDLGAQGPDATYGYGMADGKAALHLALGKEMPSNVIDDGGTTVFTFRGEISGDDGPAVQTFPKLEVHQDGVAEASFPVKPGASSIDAELSWSGDAGFEVYLSDGESTYGPYTEIEDRGDRKVVEVTRSEDVEQGQWSVLAEPSGAAQTSYTATVAVDYTASTTSSNDGTPEPGPVPLPGPLLVLLLILVGVLAIAIAALWKRRRAGRPG